jgi:Kelch motif
VFAERNGMKKPAHFPRGAFYLLLLLAIYVIPFALAHRQSDVPPQSQNPSGFVCYGCPSNGWHAGPDMPSTAVRTVGVYFWPNDNFYAVGGRSMDGVGNDFTHPFEFNRGTNTWSIKSATYPDNQVSDMACGILTDSGTNYIYCVGGSAGGQTTATDRIFRYNPITDTIETIPSPWPGDADGITLPGGFVAFNGKLYILGGFRINTEMIDTIWEFTPGTNTWIQKAAHLPVPLGYIPTTAIFNLIYTGGGSTWDGTTIHDSNYSFVYDPIADSISTIASIPRATGETRAIRFAPLGDTDYEMWVMGGGRDAPNPSSEVDTYEIFFQKGWSTFGSFLTPRRNFAVDGDVSCYMWLAGGYGSDGTPLSSMEFFCFPAPTPTATATFTPTPTATHTPTATPTATPTPTPTPCTGRCTPTPRPRPTPAPRP